MLITTGYGQTDYMPHFDGEWWQIVSKPELPPQYDSPTAEPVDFSIWQAADGTWQLVSCIRNCGPSQNIRILYRWEAQSLFDEDWEAAGVFMTSDPAVGEEAGWIQAPHVVRIGSVYKMYYGGGGQICLAESEDGKTFTRVIKNGFSRLFMGEELPRARDAMFLESNGLYHIYYTGHIWPAPGAVFVRTTTVLDEWGEEVKVAEGGSAGDNFESAECPFVVQIKDQYYFFRTQQYTPTPKTTVYRSPDSQYFGISDDQYRLGTLNVAAPEIFQYQGAYYMAALLPDLSGMRVAKLVFPENSLAEELSFAEEIGATPVGGTENGYHSDWFGIFIEFGGRWIRHESHRWFFTGPSDQNGVWLWSPR